jgi:nitroreductase
LLSVLKIATGGLLMSEPGIFEVIHSARALRRFKSDPVPEHVVTQILKAATCAPSGGNSQDSLFVVIADADRRKRVAAAYTKASYMVRPFYAQDSRPLHMSEDEYRHLRTAGFYLHEHMDEAPMLILVCARNRAVRKYEGGDARTAARQQLCTRFASIYPAAQNVILACRALGLGTVLTTNHILCEEEVKAALDLPDEVETYALLPIGYPTDKFGPVRRRPLSEVAIHDRWGNPWTDSR